MISRNGVSVSVGVVLTVWWMHYFFSHSSDFSLLSRAAALPLCLLAGCCLLLSFFNAYQLKILARHLGAALSFAQWFGLYRLTVLANCAGPAAAGTAIKAAYLRRFYGTSIPCFIAASAGALLIRIAVHLGAAVLTITAAGRLNSPLGRGSLGLFGAVLLLMLGACSASQWENCPGRLALIAAQWRNMIRSGKIFLPLFAANLGVIAASALRLWASFRCFSAPLPLTSCLIIACLNILSKIINITPGNVGLRETLVASLAALMGAPAGAALQASALERVIEMLITLVVGGHFALHRGEEEIGSRCTS